MSELHDNVMSERILSEVKIWARQRDITLFPKKTYELAALVADSEANGASDSSWMNKWEYAEHIKRLRKLREEFRIKGQEVPMTERER